MRELFDKDFHIDYSKKRKRKRYRALSACSLSAGPFSFAPIVLTDRQRPHLYVLSEAEGGGRPRMLSLLPPIPLLG